MGLRLNNSFFKVINSSFRTISPLIILPVGQIFRVVNTGGTTDSLSYTKIDGSSTSTGNITSGSITYILAVSGSLIDTGSAGSLNQLAITNLLITSSVDETPTFTEQIITTAGAGTFTKPLGVTQVIVECWGGGGAGGGVTQINSGGGGGAGGQYVRKYMQYSSPGQNISYTIGAGGVRTTGNGNNGQDTTWATNIAIAKGGASGSTSTTELPSGDPGLGSLIGAIGDVIYKGGDGRAGQYFARSGGAYGGGGGGGVGSTGTGKTEPSNGKIGGAPTPEYGGEGATGPELSIAGATGVPGFIYAAGGSGAAKISGGSNYLGGAGAQGLIRLIYR